MRVVAGKSKSADPGTVDASVTWSETSKRASTTAALPKLRTTMTVRRLLVYKRAPAISAFQCGFAALLDRIAAAVLNPWPEALFAVVLGVDHLRWYHGDLLFGRAERRGQPEG
eukprot:642819-Rhodomonas_salina.1